MAFSPSRRPSGAPRPYTQTRGNSQYPYTSDFPQRSQYNQYSPDISSPRLNINNAESQYQRIQNANSEDLKIKLETVLKHNSQLLNENATLSQMVNGLRSDVTVLKNAAAFAEKRISEDLALQVANKELHSTLETLRHNQIMNDKQLEKLLAQISSLHDQMYQIESRKDAQIKQLRDRYQRQLTLQAVQIKKSSEEGSQIRELQIKKLKQTLELRDFQIDALNAKIKNQNAKIQSENESLRMEIKHIQQLKEIQIKQVNSRTRQTINSTIKQFQRDKAIQISHYQNSIKKLKKQIANKNLEIQQKDKVALTLQDESQSEILATKFEKEKLLEQLRDLEEEYSSNIKSQKKRISELSDMEKQNMQNILESQKECMRAENQKLNILIVSKNNQIKRLFQIIHNEKEAYEKEIQTLQTLVIDLRRKIKEIQQENLEELEHLKIKMGQLHQGDLKNIESYFENQIAALLTQNRQIRESNTINKQKWFDLLQKNDDLRKTFEVQLSKQKARVLDLKVKLAALNAEHKEQITSLGTKMQLTSQTLLRQTSQKQKGQAFFEAQKKKFYTIINSKDRQIASLGQTMEKLKKLHAEQKEMNRQDIAELKAVILDKQKQMKEFKRNIEYQFEQKRQRLIGQLRKSPDDQLFKENKALRDRVQELEANIFTSRKQIEYVHKENKSLQQQLGLKAGFLETMQLQSQAAIQDEKSRMKILWGQSEVALKNYFQDKVASKERDNNNLKEQMASKENDIRELIIRYNALQGKMKSLLEAQDKLEQFYSKIVNIGLDQNLIKNLAQLFSRYKKD